MFENIFANVFFRKSYRAEKTERSLLYLENALLLQKSKGDKNQITTKNQKGDLLASSLFLKT